MYNRREFLAQMTIVVMLPCHSKLLSPQNAQSSSTGFDRNELQALRFAMDEIVPEKNGMPAVTAVGGADYLRFLGSQFPRVQEEVKTFLTALSRASRAMFGTGFEEVDSEGRTQLLKDLDTRSAPKLFGSFVRYVYEAYYAQPRVLGLIACELNLASATDEDDDIILLPVRKMTRRYREVKTKLRKSTAILETPCNEHRRIPSIS